jgi:hypothetical protein
LQPYIRTLTKPFSVSVPDGICWSGTNQFIELEALVTHRICPTTVLPGLPSLQFADAIVEVDSFELATLQVSAGPRRCLVSCLVPSIVCQKRPDNASVVICKGTSCDVLMPARQ